MYPFNVQMVFGRDNPFTFHLYGMCNIWFVWYLDTILYHIECSSKYIFVLPGSFMHIVGILCGANDMTISFGKILPIHKRDIAIYQKKDGKNKNISIPSGQDIIIQH